MVDGAFGRGRVMAGLRLLWIDMNLRNLSGGFSFRLSYLLLVLLLGIALLLCKEFINSLLQCISSPTEWYVGFSSSTPTKYKVICVIMTTVSNWETKGKAVRNTWAPRCHKALFFYTKPGNVSSSSSSSSSIYKEPRAIGLDVPDGRNHLTAKTFAALGYSYKKYASEADYFMKADDDTYVIMENLQRILRKFRSTPLLYLGRRIGNLLPRGYNSGGAGYVMSRDAVDLMLQNRSSFPKQCPKDGAVEDYDIGRCLAQFEIYPQDELDETGRLTFHSDNPLLVLRNNSSGGAYYINTNSVEFGNKKMMDKRGFMLSRWTVTMHYVSPSEMYMFDFLLYCLERDSAPRI